MAFVPIPPDCTGWKELAKIDGLEGAVVQVIPAKRFWRHAHVFGVLSVEKEAVITVVLVVLVDKTSEEPDVGILGFGNDHGGKRCRDLKG